MGKRKDLETALNGKRSRLLSIFKAGLKQVSSSTTRVIAEKKQRSKQIQVLKKLLR